MVNDAEEGVSEMWDVEGVMETNSVARWKGEVQCADTCNSEVCGAIAEETVGRGVGLSVDSEVREQGAVTGHMAGGSTVYDEGV